MLSFYLCFPFADSGYLFFPSPHITTPVWPSSFCPFFTVSHSSSKPKALTPPCHQSFSNFWTDPEPNDYATLTVNTVAPLKLTRIALHALLAANKPGVVLTVSSIAGYGPGAYAVPLYCASKHAVVGFTRSMRKADAEEGVKVVCLTPGVVRTPLWTPGEKGDINLLKDFNYHPATILEPDAVAQAAVELVERGVYGGGTVLEVTTDGTRVVPEWNVAPPPQGERNTGAPAEIVPPVGLEVGEFLKRERGLKARL